MQHSISWMSTSGRIPKCMSPPTTQTIIIAFPGVEGGEEEEEEEGLKMAIHHLDVLRRSGGGGGGGGGCLCRYLKVVDKFNDKYFISSFAKAGCMLASVLLCPVCSPCIYSITQTSTS